MNGLLERHSNDWRVGNEACMTKYLTAYAKIVDDRDHGIMLQGVYFGGVGDTLAEAEQYARDCVNSVRGGTVLPKVVELTTNNVLDAMSDLTERFEYITNQMVQADAIISRTQSRKK